MFNYNKRFSKVTILGIIHLVLYSLFIIYALFDKGIGNQVLPFIYFIIPNFGYRAPSITAKFRGTSFLPIPMRIMEIINYNSEFTNAYYLTDNIKPVGYVPYPAEKMIACHGYLYHLYDCYVGNKLVICDNYIYDFYNHDRRGEYTAGVRGQIHCAILVIKYWNTYGHNLHDLLATILLFPEEVLNKNPYIFHDWDNKLLEEHLDALGLFSIRIYPWQLEFVRCDELYYIHPSEVAHEFTGYSLPKMHDMFRKRFKLDSIIPTKYNMLNKKPTESRHFTNFVELQTELNAKYKPIQWNIIEMCNSLEEKGKQFAETLFLIASGGSIVYHALFMRERSSIVVFFADLVDLPDLSLICMLKMYGIGIQHQNMSHYQGSGTIYINKTLDAVEKLMYTMKNGEYPYMKGYRPSYNISVMKKRMYNNYNYRLGGEFNLPEIK